MNENLTNWAFSLRHNERLIGGAQPGRGCNVNDYVDEGRVTVSSAATAGHSALLLCFSRPLTNASWAIFLADGVLFLFLFFSYHYIFLSDFLITGACSPLCCYPKNQIIILPLFTIAHSSLFELRPQLRRHRHHPAPTALLSYILHVYHLSHDRLCSVKNSGLAFRCLHST